MVTNEQSSTVVRETVESSVPNLRRIAAVLSSREDHWVGDGFFVSTILSPQRIDAQMISPFLLLDHAAPRMFPPGTRRRGVGEHPHRGFETVTFAYEGEVEHRDSRGGGGKIGPGDVQWMTAASGVVHEEFHSEAFTRRGGRFEMVQLWVNLPARLKMTAPRYQSLKDADFPRFSLRDAAVRLIAGSLAGNVGPAKTHSPMTVFDLTFERGGSTTFSVDEGTTVLAFVLKGSVRAQGEANLDERDLVVFDRATAGGIRLDATAEAKVLVLCGEPLDEPVVAYGPFVMNTREEIAEAIRDYQRGRMGSLVNDAPGRRRL